MSKSVSDSKHWFTTSFLWRKVPESDARSLEEGAGKRCSECESVYVRVAHDLELLRYVLRCALERQL